MIDLSTLDVHSSLEENWTIKTSTCLWTWTTSLQAKSPVDELVFGHTFTDHMLVIDWSLEGGMTSLARPWMPNFNLISIKFKLLDHSVSKYDKDDVKGVTVLMTAAAIVTPILPIQSCYFISLMKHETHLISSWCILYSLWWKNMTS